MPSSRQAFRLRDTARLIRAAQDAGLKITGVTLNHDLVTLLVADGAAPAQEAEPAGIAEPPR